MNDTRGQRRLVIPLATAIALLLAASAGAQTTTSSIRGVVKDANGPVAGATIDAVDTRGGSPRSATSDESGRFALPGLAAGNYVIAVSTASGATASQEVQLLVAQDVEMDITVAENSIFTEDVMVFGSGVRLLVETKDSQVATNVTQQQIESLPQNNRNFLRLAALAPGVRFTDDEDLAGQKFRGGAQDARQVNVFIDGMSYKNDLLQGGAFMQDSSRGNPFPQSAVQEFRVLTQNYKAEYEKASSAVITAVTKSGGNAFHGDVFYYFQDKDLVSQDPIAEERGDEKGEYERKQYGATFGGPIVRDKVHFFLSYEANDQDRVSTVFLGPAFPFAPSNVQNFLSTFETGVLTSPFESDLFFGKVSWDAGGFQDLYGTYYSRDEQEIRGFGGQRTRDGAESFEVGTDAVVLKHQWVRGSLLNEAAVDWQELAWRPIALASDTPRMNFIGILDVGGKDATQDFQQDRLAFRDDASYVLDWHGGHALKGGISYSRLEYDVTKQLFENGLFEFRGDEQWQFPFQARVGFGDPTLAFDNDQLGLYVQDDWQVRPDLTVNVGVRWDYESNMINNDYRTPPELVSALEGACRTYGAPVGGQSTWCLRDFLDLEKYTTGGSDRDAYYGMVQPRIGFAWDIRGNGKSVLFGGWGKYYDRVVLNDIFDEQYRQQFKIFSFCFSADGSPAPGCPVPALAWRPEFLSAEALRALVASGQAPGPEVFLVSNEMKPPRSDQYTLGVRQQLGGWLTSVAYAGVRSYNNLMYFFGDLPPGTRFEDRFGNNVGVPGYARVFVTSTARRNWYDGLLVSIDRPLTSDGKWGLNVAYTYAKAKQTGTDNGGEGVAFGAFDYLDSSTLYKFDGTNDERHRLVVSGTALLPWSFQVSTLITLGSGVPFTVFDDSVGPFRVGWNEGRPEQQDFIIPDAWAYRSVDLRLEWTAPPIRDVRITLVGEGFNIFNFDNFKDFESFKPRLPNVNPRFGEPNGAYNPRRLQFGARVAF